MLQKVSFTPMKTPLSPLHPSAAPLLLQHRRQRWLCIPHSALAFGLKHEANQPPAGFSFYLTKSQHNKKREKRSNLHP